MPLIFFGGTKRTAVHNKYLQNHPEQSALISRGARNQLQLV